MNPSYYYGYGYYFCYRWFLGELAEALHKSEKAEMLRKRLAVRKASCPKASPPKRHRTYNWH